MDDEMPAWAHLLNERVDQFGWAERDRPRRLSERTGGAISPDLCRKYLEGGVDQPRGKNMARLAEAVGLSEAELRGLEPVRNGNDPLTNASIPSPGETELLAKMEAKMQSILKELWIEIGKLQNRIEQLEHANHEKRERSPSPTKAR